MFSIMTKSFTVLVNVGNRSISHRYLEAFLQGIDFQLLQTGIHLWIPIKMLTLN